VFSPQVAGARTSRPCRRLQLQDSCCLPAGQEQARVLPASGTNGARMDLVPSGKADLQEQLSDGRSQPLAAKLKMQLLKSQSRLPIAGLASSKPFTRTPSTTESRPDDSAAAVTVDRCVARWNPGGGHQRGRYSIDEHQRNKSAGTEAVRKSFSSSDNDRVPASWRPVKNSEGLLGGRYPGPTTVVPSRYRTPGNPLLVRDLEHNYVW
jgi:hypothetical protein